MKIPVDKDKEVEQVLFFPEGQAPQSLAFERVGDVVIFTAPHFTHYAIVYKPAQTEGPDQPINQEENRLNLISLFNQLNQINQSNQLPQ